MQRKQKDQVLSKLFLKIAELATLPNLFSTPKGTKVSPKDSSFEKCRLQKLDYLILPNIL